MKRYSKRVREEAAWLASVAACRRPSGDFALSDVEYQFSHDARQLFWEAWCQADDYRRTHRTPISDVDIMSRLIDAEAEALIRTGWSPPNG